MSDNTVDEQATAPAAQAPEAASANADPPTEVAPESPPASEEAPADPPADPPADSPAEMPENETADPPVETAAEAPAVIVTEPEEESPPASPEIPSAEAEAEPLAGRSLALSAPADAPADDAAPAPRKAPPEEPEPVKARALPVANSGPPTGTPPAYEPSKPSTALLNEKKPDAFDAESTQVKLKYPKSVFFIISNEFCERFSYYGMRTILVLYLTSTLRYEQDDATVIYHVFTMFCYFFPILGSMIADSWLGKFKTIFFLSIVYAIGNIVISLASASDSIDIPGRALTIVGLLLIAFGTGGIKPCVSAFGGDQFKLPQQAKQMAQFFSLFYFAINSGSLVSTFLTPVLREDVNCFGQASCYPLAFGVPAALMIVSIVIFVAGKSLYIIKKPQGNVVVQVSKCMGHALSQKIRSKGPKRDHWLDYADDEYDRKQIEDIKSALRVLFLYLPLPFFWALFDQQGSRWTFQATRMTGKLGGWSLKPDQMQVVNPLLILLFIPMFETIIYPLLKKCNLLTRPLQRLGVGGILAGLAFVISAVVELQLEPSYAVVPGSGEGQIRIFNGLSCNVPLNIDNEPAMSVPQHDIWLEQHWSVSNQQIHTVTYTNCDAQTRSSNIIVKEKVALSFLITPEDIIQISVEDEVEKEKEVARIRVIYNGLENDVHIGTTSFENIRTNHSGYGESELQDLTPADYSVFVNGNDNDIGSVNLLVGGVYALMISGTDSYKLFEITPPNEVHMLWLIPQYVVITMGEVMFSITGLEFSYSQSPLSMKSVMQAGWLLTVAFGNLIVVIIAEAKFFDRQLWEFVLFAGLMLVDMLVFALMAMGYKYIETPHEGQDLPLEPTEEKHGIENANFKRDDE